MNVVLDARWAEVVWLSRWGTAPHRVAVNDDVLEVRSVQRRPLAELWSRVSLDCIQAALWKNPAPPFGVVPPVVLPSLRAVELADRVLVRPEFASRWVCIRLSDLETWRYSSSCRSSMQMRQGFQAAGVPHTAACRDRIERAMCVVGDQRLANAEERITEFIAEQVAVSEHQQKEWIRQEDYDDGGRYTEDWIVTVATDGSRKRTPGKCDKITKESHQYQQHGNARKRIHRCDVFAFKKTLERAVLPLTILIDNVGLYRAWTEENRTTHPIVIQMTTDEWSKIFQAFRKVEEEVGFEKLLVVRHVKTRVHW